jgi:hypothetical protein
MCSGCGLCCTRVGNPPFGALDASLPPEWTTWEERPDRPCRWYDPETKTCREYDRRPELCRRFEVGGRVCTAYREGRSTGELDGLVLIRLRLRQRVATRTEPGGKLQVVQPEPCEYRGAPTAPPDGLPTAKSWVLCEHPERPLGAAVCSCHGCGPTCRGYPADVTRPEPAG